MLHAHPPTATGYAVAHIPLDRYTMIETVAAIGSIPVTPYGTPSTYEVPDAIAPYLQEHDVLLPCKSRRAYGRCRRNNRILPYGKHLSYLQKSALRHIFSAGEKEISRENTTS